MDKRLEIKDKTMLITDIQLGVMEYLNHNSKLLVKILHDSNDRTELKNFLDIIKHLNLTRYGNVINLISDNQKTYKNYIIEKFSEDPKLTPLTHLLSTKISVLHKFDDDKYNKYKKFIQEYSQITIESADQVMIETQELITKLNDIFDETFRIWASDA